MLTGVCLLEIYPPAIFPVKAEFSLRLLWNSLHNGVPYFLIAGSIMNLHDI